ncbi:MAG TPA: ribosome biogenesis GTP-binding protein YihA/YsxC [Saprospiraceae bacterium]|nr:ribosome biogenesis GTP-binding protein YihA/YsxC [Saprospiraceae bacterium]
MTIQMEEKALDVHYIGSYKDVSQCPAFDLPEYCFIGRSNVGKSSIINLVTGRREIARTSRKPGKTQSINLFNVEEPPSWLIADLPGYGFAQVSKSTRGQWSSLIDKYIVERKNLMCTFLLLDIRHPRMENDRAFMNFLGQNHIPFCILFTKSDKLKPAELITSIEAYKEEILNEWEELPRFIVTSSEEKLGRDEILGYILQMNNIFAQQAL